MAWSLLQLNLKPMMALTMEGKIERVGRVYQNEDGTKPENTRYD